MDHCFPSIILSKLISFLPLLYLFLLHKVEFLRELYRGLPLVECYHYLILSPKGEFLRTPCVGPIGLSYYLIPQRRVSLRNPPSGSHWFYGSLYTILLWFQLRPPQRPFRKTPLIDWFGRWEGVFISDFFQFRIFLPIFLMFLSVMGNDLKNMIPTMHY